MKFKPSLTIDCWTGQNRKSYIASNVHFYLKSESKLKSGLIFIKELPPFHTAENIRNMFKDLRREIKLKYFLIATYNAINMNKAFKTGIFLKPSINLFQDKSLKLFNNNNSDSE